MSKNPPASIIIPAFNEERTIKAIVDVCLKSKVPVEVVCVNDGSTDGTPEILESFGNKITLINFDSNKGKGCAMAEAIKKSKGEILIFIDADVVGLKAKHIELLYKTFIEKKLDGLIVLLNAPEIIKFIEAIILNPYQKGQESLTGERVYYKKDIMPHVNKIASLGYGVEVYLNSIYRDKKLDLIKLSGVTVLFKYHKKGWSLETIGEYLNEFREINKAWVDQKIVPKIRRYKKPLTKLHTKIKGEFGSVIN